MEIGGKQEQSAETGRPQRGGYGLGTVMIVGSNYLLVLGEREAIAWVLRDQRMAFPMRRRAAANRLTVGDELLLYATRGAWHNPKRDRGKIFGLATVTSAVAELDEPIEIAGMRFQSACDLRIDGVVPYPGGVEVQPLVHQLAVFPKPDAWSVYLRRPLVALPVKDAALLRELVDPMLRTRDQALRTYEQALPTSRDSVPRRRAEAGANAPGR